MKNAKNPDAVVTFKGKKGTALEFARGPIERLRNIEVLVDTVPPGLVIEKDSARVTSDGNWTIIGKFTLHYRGATRSLAEGSARRRARVDRHRRGSRRGHLVGARVADPDARRGWVHPLGSQGQARARSRAVKACGSLISRSEQSTASCGSTSSGCRLGYTRRLHTQQGAPHG